MNTKLKIYTYIYKYNDFKEGQSALRINDE